MKNLKWPKHSVLIVAVIATWLTTYFSYVTSFNMKIENGMQEFILFINPLSFLLIIYGLSLFMKTEKAKNRYILTVSILTSIIIFANAVFYRFFNDFITLPLLFQTSNFKDLTSSTLASIHWSDIFFFTDVVIIYLAMRYIPKRQEEAMHARRHSIGRKLYFVLSAMLLMVNLGLAETERPQLLSRSFDRELLVKNIGAYNYHLYDIFIQSKSHAQRVLADGSELAAIENYVNAKYAEPNDEMYGIAKDKNIILVTLESLQTFVINNDMLGHEVTPFLNELTRDKDTLYYSNFYHQTGLGKTSDSEFIVENGLYPRDGSAVFFTHSGNTYNSMAHQFAKEGYFTNVMHPNNRSFWNRDIMYQALGIEEFFDVESYEIGEGDAVNWGMKDIPFLDQSVDIMKELPQPFYTRMILLTNHHPFTLDEEDMMIPQYNSNSRTLNRYFQTVRYMDEAIRLFFEDLKESGLYEDSIIIMYGDHYGISENHNKAMGMYLDKEITPYDNALLQKVPLFIHIPGYGEGKEVDRLAGQLDIRPTVLHMAGIDTKGHIEFGQDLFSKDHEEFVIFRDGRFVTPDSVYAEEKCYDAETGERKSMDDCTPYLERATEELEYSEMIINGDLLRFHDKDGRIEEMKDVKDHQIKEGTPSEQ